MSITIYGIKNCATMKKAFDKLESLAVDYQFFDYKKSVLSEAEFVAFAKAFGIEKVINKKGTTYRKFDETTKQRVEAAIAKPDENNLNDLYQIIKENQSLIKRPIIMGDKQAVGFDDASYQQLFG